MPRTQSEQPENAYILRIQNGEQKELIPFTSEVEITIGRAVENRISLLDDRCSRFHAKVYFDSGKWILKDLGSRNGTFVDDKQVLASLCELHHDSQIQIGHSTLKFGYGIHENTDTVNETEEDEVHSGIFGVTGELLRAPEAGDETATGILRRTSQTSLLKTDVKGKPNSQLTTRTGFGAVELCRLAYQLGKSGEITQIARAAIEGLLKATGADGAGLWLFPYNLKSTQNASAVRLVANATLENLQYNVITESIVRTIFDKKEACLFHEPNINLKTGSKAKQKEGSVNTLVAPIRFQNAIQGLVHLYTVKENKQFDDADLHYTLAVADTLGVALANMNKQKELAANLTQARKENSDLREMLQMNSEIIGKSDAMARVNDLILRAATGKATVLIRGESGVGKELIARAIHLASPRKAKSLICMNCAAISENLLESELFGHEKGSFTGATERKIGKFEAANTGTLFLDEIGEMSQSLQAKFLRVLEGSAFERVGGNSSITVDVRVLAATNRDLEKEVAEGRFRHDLFFRLRVLEIIVPPLRKRAEDIPLLAEFFLDRYCKETGRRYDGFDQEAMRVLTSYRWPGNIRELKNVIERAVVLGNGQSIQEQDLLLSTLNTTGESGVRLVDEPQDVFIPLSLEDMERNHIMRTLEHLQWNKSLVAKQLGIERTTLDRKIKRYGLEKTTHPQ
ncbi:MAG: sigma 54-interacting transcriptional regulator [Planctomycetaceae bacterium]|jgi:Nif-specific regulatory protein|nr:sigma 54-interacting transcriptional regulator [Planctomycetaceae bacterium]